MAGFPPHGLGLALSGGGSRAAAFHRGVLRALLDLNLATKVDVVSTVSGGSVFGGAWMAARRRGVTDEDFLQDMRGELSKGFIRRSVRPDLIKALLPFTGYSRTDLIARTFDDVFFSGLSLSHLPDRPALCINVALLNNGQVGKFSRQGFSAWDIAVPRADPSRVVPWPDFSLARAVAASAAFPVGLPPLDLARSSFPEGTEFRGRLEGAKHLALTDGGVLENLGVQTLLRSRRFAAWDLIVSDAGTADKQWNPSGWAALKGLGIWTLSGRILDRLMIVMNGKQNRWARQEVMDALEQSWLAEELRSGAQPSPALATYLGAFDRPHRPRRKLLFIRVDQSWESFLGSISRHRLVELALRAGMDLETVPPEKSKSQERRRFLEAAGVDLARAEDMHRGIGGGEGTRAANEVATNFTGLSDTTLDLLAGHAAWQIHAAHEIYW